MVLIINLININGRIQSSSSLRLWRYSKLVLVGFVVDKVVLEHASIFPVIIQTLHTYSCVYRRVVQHFLSKSEKL
jgi:hypothetical protein